MQCENEEAKKRHALDRFPGENSEITKMFFPTRPGTAARHIFFLLLLIMATAALSAEDEAIFQAHVRSHHMACNKCGAAEVPLYGSNEANAVAHFLLLCKTCAIAQRKKLEAFWREEKKTTAEERRKRKSKTEMAKLGKRLEERERRRLKVQLANDRKLREELRRRGAAKNTIPL